MESAGQRGDSGPGFPRLKEWAYAGMFFNMTGAFISYLVERDYGAAGMHLTVAAGIVALVLASCALRPADRMLVPMNSGR